MDTSQHKNVRQGRSDAPRAVDTHFRLPPDVAEALFRFPPRARTAVVVAALRHYLLPGGYREMLTVLEDRLSGSAKTGVGIGASEERVAAKEQARSLLAAFGAEEG